MASGELSAVEGTEVSGLHPVRHGGDFGLLDFFLGLRDCAKASKEPTDGSEIIRSSAIADRAIADCKGPIAPRKCAERGMALNKWRVLIMARGSGVGIFSERVRIAFTQNFHHPAVKIIDGMVHDGLEAAVVFSMSFLNVIFQSDAKILIFAA